MWKKNALPDTNVFYEDIPFSYIIIHNSIFNMPARMRLIWNLLLLMRIEWND